MVNTNSYGWYSLWLRFVKQLILFVLFYITDCKICKIRAFGKPLYGCPSPHLYKNRPFDIRNGKMASALELNAGFTY